LTALVTRDDAIAPTASMLPRARLRKETIFALFRVDYDFGC
jgi:hypothetical protein